MVCLISPYSIGIEIEVKFRYYFPEVFAKYFQDGTPFLDRPSWEQELINKKISKIEEDLLPRLEKTKEKIPRGGDRYWEFAFNPTYNITELSKQVEELRSEGLIPVGEHSLHITIGGLEANKHMYYVLFLMELEFLKKERIMAGFSPKGWSDAWAKKGRGGIYIKRGADLIGADIGVELRTLMLYPETNLETMLGRLITLINDPHLVVKYKNILNKYDLPDINWEFPYRQKETWIKYINCFDEMKGDLNEVE